MGQWGGGTKRGNPVSPQLLDCGPASPPSPCTSQEGAPELPTSPAAARRRVPSNPRLGTPSPLPTHRRPPRPPPRSSALLCPRMGVRSTYVAEFVPLSDFLVILRDCGEPLFIIQKITAVRPPPGRSHRRGSCESLTAPSGCTHTQYGWHLEHLGKETQPGDREDRVKQGVRRSGRPWKTCFSRDGGRGRRRQAETGRPLPSGCTPKPRHSHTRRPADPGEERWV